MAIRIVNRSLDIPISERNIGHTGDNLVEVRIFELNRYYSNIDLSEFDFKLDTQVGDIKNIIDLDKAISGDKIVLTWLIKESHLTAPGRMSIQIRAFKGTEEKWHSAQAYVRVQPSINAEQSIPDPLPSEFEQIEQRVTVAKNAAEEAAQMATEQAGIVQQIVERAEIDVLPALNQSIEDAGQAKDLLDGSIEAAGTAKSNLDGSISAAGEAKTDLDGVITQAGTVKGQLDGSITQAGTKKTELDGSITAAGQVKEELDESIATGDLAAFRQEFTEHKNDFTTYRDNNNLKISKVEKELSDYKSTMATLNPNHEAKQSVSGYGVVSLPKNAANGQISVTAKGLTVTNLVQNGDFRNGTSGWLANNSTLSADNGVLRITATGTSGSSNTSHYLFTNRRGQKLYVRVKAKVTNSECQYIRLYVGLTSVYQYTPEANKEYLISDVLTMPIDDANIWYVVYHGYENAEVATGKVMEIREAMTVDLTAMFGAGNEPTKEECDQIFANYFDGTKSTVSASRLKSVGKNLFEPGINGWIKDGAGELTYDNGTYYYKRTSSSYIDQIYKLYKVKPNTNFVLSYNLLSYTVGHGMRVCDGDITGTVLSQDSSNAIGRHILAFTSVSDTVCIAFRGHSAGMASAINDVQLEQGTAATPYETYTESTQYITAKDEEGNILELRSLPNGVKDEIRLSEGKAIIKISIKTDVASGTVINYADMADGGQFVAYYADGMQQIGVKGDTLTADAVQLNYQLAEPVEIPIQVSGSIVSYPSGTIYIERILPDAGVYTDKMEVLHKDLPIKSIEKLSKVDFYTGVETELDVSEAVIASDKLSFTHPDLSEGDIVFFEYEYDVESTEGETEVEFYDSRYVVKDDVTGKFYKWNVKVSNGTPTIEVVEV